MEGRSFYDDFPATAYLLLFILAFYVLELVESQRHGLLGVGIPPEVTRDLAMFSYAHIIHLHQWDRLVTPIFLHLSLWHILFNAYVLLDIGRVTEARLSSWKFFVIYTASGLGGTLMSLSYNAILPPFERYQAAGASGALSGLIGLWLVFAVRRRDEDLRDRLVRWVIMIVIFSLAIGRVDHAGHLGGFVVGALFGYFAMRSDSTSSREAARWVVPRLRLRHHRRRRAERQPLSILRGDPGAEFVERPVVEIRADTNSLLNACRVPRGGGRFSANRSKEGVERASSLR